MMVLDNYLPADVFTALQTAIQATTFPWEASKVLSPRPKQLETAYNFQYIHGFFFDKPGFKHRSDSFNLVEPIIQKLAPQELIKIKANKTLRQERQIEYGLHVDTRRPGATTAILYLNTNNGYTVFEDGEKVRSVENRLVLFVASRKHSGASCTDADCRLVLNINMILQSTGG